MSRSRGGMALTFVSPIQMLPPVGFSSPATNRSAVVFPHPEGPTRIRNSPSPTSRERSSSATTSSENRFVTCSRTTSATALSLQARRRDAADEVALGDEEQQKHRQQAHHVGGHQKV